MGNAVEAEFPEGNVDPAHLFLTGNLYLVSKALKGFIELGSSPPFLLLLLEFLLVTISMFALAISSFVELHVGSFAIKLNIFRLLLPNHDGVLEVNVNNNNQFMRTWLEKQMLYVTEKDIDLTAPVIDVAKPILMDVHIPRDSLAIQSWPDKDVIEALRFAI